MSAEEKMISEGLMAYVAERLRTLGQPTRLRLVELLAAGPSTPQELSDALGLSQQNVSKHLLSLHRAGIVSRSPDGVRVVYELVAADAVDVLRLTVDGVTHHLEQLARLAAAPDERPE